MAILCVYACACMCSFACAWHPVLCGLTTFFFCVQNKKAAVWPHGTDVLALNPKKVKTTMADLGEGLGGYSPPPGNLKEYKNSMY